VIQEALLVLAERIQKLEYRLAKNMVTAGSRPPVMATKNLHRKAEGREAGKRAAGKQGMKVIRSKQLPYQNSRQILDNLLTSK